MLLLLLYIEKFTVIGQYQLAHAVIGHYLGSPCMALVYKVLCIICCRLVVGVVAAVYREVYSNRTLSWLMQ